MKKDMQFAVKKLGATLLVWAVIGMMVSGCTRQPEQLVRDGWITDRANILSQPDKLRISTTLAEYEKETCHQIFVLTIPSLAGEKMADFSYRTAYDWNIGQPRLGNGILLTIAMKEGTMRIETASAFDWFVEQGVSERILKQVMVPYFKNERDHAVSPFEGGF
jgi:uncharacterized protein